MALYSYVALKGQNLVKGKIDAENSRQARAKIRTMGLVPTKLYEENKSDEKESTGGK